MNPVPHASCIYCIQTLKHSDISIYLSVHLFIYLSACLPIGPSVHPSVCLSACLAMSLSVCLYKSVHLPSISALSVCYLVPLCACYDCMQMYKCLSMRVRVYVYVYIDICSHVYTKTCKVSLIHSYMRVFIYLSHLLLYL